MRCRMMVGQLFRRTAPKNTTGSPVDEKPRPLNEETLLLIQECMLHIGETVAPHWGGSARQ
jgi:hypothetical protein